MFGAYRTTRVRGRVVRHPALAVPHLSLAHIGHLDFEGLKAMGCKGIIFDKVTITNPRVCLSTMTEADFFCHQEGLATRGPNLIRVQVFYPYLAKRSVADMASFCLVVG